MADITTADYVKGIAEAQQAGHTVNIDFGNLPKGIDASAVANALTTGLDSGYKTGITDAVKAGHAVNLDFSTALPDPNIGIKSAVSKVAHPVLEIGGQIGGGALGLAGGAMTAPVTGPYGAVAGEGLGAGLGKTAGKMGADLIDQGMGYRNLKEPPLTSDQIPGYVARGGAEQLVGSKIIGPLIGKGATMAKAGMEKVAPGTMSFLTDLSDTVANKIIKNPAIAKMYAGSTEAIEGAVGKVQDALKALKDRASTIYDAAKTAAGISTDNSGSAAAEFLGKGGGKTVPLTRIGKMYTDLMKNASKLDPKALMQGLNSLKEYINDHLTPAAFGQKAEEITTRSAAKLNAMKTDIMTLMDTLPGGKELLHASENWHQMRQVYDLLVDKVERTGPGTEFFKKVFSEDSVTHEPYRQAITTLDKTLGIKAGEELENQVASHAANKLIPPALLAKERRKLIAMAAAFAPGRMVTVPALMAIQSPKMMLGAYNAAQAGASAVAAHAPAIGAGMMALADKVRTGMMGPHDK